MKKRFFLAAMTLLVSMGAFAQGNGIAGISEATNMVTSYFDPGTKLIYGKIHNKHIVHFSVNIFEYCMFTPSQTG